MTRVAFAILGLPALLLAAAAVGEEKEQPPRTISQIMIAAHLRPENRSTRNNLDSKVIDGKATDEEKQQLLKLYQELTQSKPPVGDLDAWKKRTGEIVAATQAVIRGERGSAERLTAARDCKACHMAHRPASQAAIKNNEAKEELQRLQGEWSLVSMEIQGRKRAGEEATVWKLTVKDDQWLMTRGPDRNAKFKIDPTLDPKSIDRAFRHGENPDEPEQTWLGIYKLEGDVLTICHFSSTTERPKEFATSEERGTMIVWRRVKE